MYLPALLCVPALSWSSVASIIRRVIAIREHLAFNQLQATGDLWRSCGSLFTPPQYTSYLPGSPLALAKVMAAAASIHEINGDVRRTPDLIVDLGNGVDNVAQINYQIRRTANVSIYFVDRGGSRHYFRKSQRRSPGKYEVYWGGVNNDPQLRQIPGGLELVEGQVLPDGDYTWVIEATDDQERQERAEGPITIRDGDSTLPEMHNLRVVPRDFSPKQDGIHDNVSISYYLTKKVDTIQLYLQQPLAADGTQGLRYPIAEDPASSTAEPGEVGYHAYQYDGGLSLNAEPPPDGTYTLTVEAQDLVGNRTMVSTTLTITEGGKPRAEIAGGVINWRGEMNQVVSVPLGQTLCFTASVSNIGPVPIRTAGPWPGQLYKIAENNSTLAQSHHDPTWYEQPGVWRFGVNFDTTSVDFPFRWAVGRPQDLQRRMVDGTLQYYLLPGHRGQVYGCILFDQKPPAGTQFWWGGLIHESVTTENDQVGRIQVDVGVP